MTNEEHIIYAENLRVALKMTNTFSAETMESLDEAIKALKQKSSDDCVSRAAAIRLAEQGQVRGFEWQLQKLITLPPITPTHKKGRWIKEYDNSALDGLYHCSICSRKLWIPKEESVSDYPYCHCGAEMEEVDE